MIKQCPNCGQNNKTTNIKCEFCDCELIPCEENSMAANFSTTNHVAAAKISPKKIGCITNIGLFFSLGMFILAGILFTGIGLYSYISEHNKTKNFDSTTATLKDFPFCRYDDDTEICEALYEYQVNGVTYTVSPDLQSNPSSFKTTETVYYNPNNPSDAIIYANCETLIITGGIILAVIITIFIVVNVKIFKANKVKKENGSNY